MYFSTLFNQEYYFIVKIGRNCPCIIEFAFMSDRQVQFINFRHCLLMNNNIFQTGPNYEWISFWPNHRFHSEYEHSIYRGTRTEPFFYDWALWTKRMGETCFNGDHLDLTKGDRPFSLISYFLPLLLLLTERESFHFPPSVLFDRKSIFFHPCMMMMLAS